MTDTAPLPAPPSRARAALAAVADHPIRTTALAGVIVAALELYWISRYRHLGGFDVDEAGYLATALRMRRDLGDGWSGLRSLADSLTENGPLVPFLSALMMLVIPWGAKTAMAVQPVLHVVGAVAVAGVTARLAGRRPATVAGLIVLGSSFALVSSHSYQFGLAAGTFLCLAMWCLLSSRRGHALVPMLGYGAAVGAMLASRTMAIGFAPAVAGAALVVCRRDRRSIRNLAGAVVAAAVVVGPWYLIAGDAIRSYLFRNGYGDRATHWGAASVISRIAHHVGLFERDVRAPLFLLTAVTLLFATVSATHWTLTRRTLRGWPPLTRPTAAVAVAVVLAQLALASTPNEGTWFDIPIEMLTIALMVAIAARLPEPVATVWAIGGLVAMSIVAPWLLIAVVPIGAVAIAVAATGRSRHPGPTAVASTTTALALVAAVLSVSPGGPPDSATARRVSFAIGQLFELQSGNTVADPRVTGDDVADRARASAEWAAANDRVVRSLERYRQRYGPLVASVSGSAHLFNINTLLLSTETLRLGWAAYDVPDTNRSERVIRTHLTPTGSVVFGGESRGQGEVPASTRVVVLIRGRTLKFPDDRHFRRFAAIAARAGWITGRRIPLPDGGDVLVLVHPPESTP